MSTGKERIMDDVDLDSLGSATRRCVEDAWQAYMKAALWSSMSEGGEPLDSLCYSTEDIAPSLRQEMLQTVFDFLSACWGDAWGGFTIDISGIEPEQVGQDLWLTQNGHGAGFWDRGLGKVGDQLTDLAKPFGETNLYVGDDGLVYAS